MKKFPNSLCLLLMGLIFNSSLAYASFPHCQVRVPEFKGGFLLGVSGLYLMPNTRELDYALTYPLVNFSDSPTPVLKNGDYRNVVPHYYWGYELFIGYELPCSGNDVKLNYRHLNTHTRDFTNAPAILSSLTDQSFFNGGDAESANGLLTSSANGHARFHYDVIDFELGQHLMLGQRTDFRCYGGIRYANLNHEFTACYQQNQFISITPINISNLVFIEQNTQFNGVGPRLGFDIDYCLAKSWAVVGHTGGALLTGEQKNRFKLNTTNSFNFLDLNETQTITFANRFHYPDEIWIVPNVDAKLGLRYTTCFQCSKSRLSLEAGWQVDYYWNTINRFAARNLPPDENLQLDRHVLDTSFNGPYLTLQITT